MRPRVLSISLFLSTMVLCSGVLAYGCGDKLLVMGRSIRLQALLGNRTARILAYQHAGTHGSDVIADSEFQSLLKSARYQLRIVRDTEELEVALRLGKYDLVLADISDAGAMEASLRAAGGAPVFLPIVYQPAKPEQALAEKHYHHVLKVQRKPGAYLSVIEQALETKFEADAKLKREHRTTGGAL